MDYNGGEQPRRTAGGNGGGQGEGEVRDWQRDVWYGSAPAYGDPFDEPADAPELRESRSENVNEHLGEFWDRIPEGYQYTGSRRKTGAGGGTRSGRTGSSGTTGARAGGGAGGNVSGRQGGRKRAARFGMGKVLLILLCVGIGVWAALRFTVFNLQDIQVEGNQRMTDEEILKISGIRKGDSLLRLDENEVERRINADYRLQFRYLKKTIPGQVTLKVREREACCWLTYGGILYTMDKNRMILYETEDIDVRPAELVEVKGLKIRSGCRTGQTLNLNDAAQETLISSLFLEMKVLGCTAMILEADMSNVSSLLMVTRDGYTVSMGDMYNLHAKLRSAMLVREKLVELGMHGGTINVVTPEKPVYSPPIG